MLRGRVLEHRPPRPARASDRRWDNFRHMMRRLASARIPGARLRAHAYGVTQEVTADNDGMFRFDLRLPVPLERPALWQAVEIELLAPLPRRQPGPIRAEGRVLVPPASARLAVVSDIDDTIIQTGAVNTLRMMGAMLFANAHTRSPFPGVAALYRALHGGCSGDEGNPMFLRVQQPLESLRSAVTVLRAAPDPRGAGALFAQLGDQRGGAAAAAPRPPQAEVIVRLLAAYPALPFVLIGDSGQQDAEFYAALVHEYPGRIAAIYIRNVSRKAARLRAIYALAEETAAAGTPMMLVADSLALAHDAARRGWIPPAALAAIRAQHAADELGRG